MSSKIKDIDISDIIDEYITTIQVDYILNKTYAYKLLANVLSDKIIKEIINSRISDILNTK